MKCKNRGEVEMSLSAGGPNVYTSEIENAVYPFKYKMTQSSIMVIFQHCYIIAPGGKNDIGTTKRKA